LLLATQLCFINTFCQMDLLILEKVFTLSFSPHIIKFQYKPSMHPKNTWGPTYKKLLLCQTNCISLDITIPNDLDLDLYFPLISHKDLFCWGQIDRSFVLYNKYRTNIEESLHSQKFRSSKLKIHLHLGKFFKFLWTPYNQAQGMRPNWLDFIFWIACYVVVMSKFHRMVEMWSVELRGDSVQSHQCVRYPLIACVFGGKGAIMCWVTWGLLIGSNPRCFEFILNPIREGSLDQGPLYAMESRPMFNSNQAFLLVQKLKLAPKGFTLGVKAKIENIFSMCPKLLINAELYSLVLDPSPTKAQTLKHTTFLISIVPNCKFYYYYF
jgi:hypothetical protein